MEIQIRQRGDMLLRLHFGFKVSWEERRVGLGRNVHEQFLLLFGWVRIREIWDKSRGLKVEIVVHRIVEWSVRWFVEIKKDADCVDFYLEIIHHGVLFIIIYVLLWLGIFPLFYPEFKLKWNLDFEIVVPIKKIEIQQTLKSFFI